MLIHIAPVPEYKNSNPLRLVDVLQYDVEKLSISTSTFPI